MPACPRCGVAPRRGARFCRGCGQRLVGEPPPWVVVFGAGPPSGEAPAGRRCPDCGVTSGPTARFCKGCGRRLPAPDR